MFSSQNFECIQQMRNIASTSLKILQNPKDVDTINSLQIEIKKASPEAVGTLGDKLFSAFYPILKTIAEDANSYKVKEKQTIVDTFKAIFDKNKVQHLTIFFNIYGFLLYEIYDHENHKVRNTEEEYKLSLVECMTSLSNCLEFSAITELYTKENTPKLSPMIFSLLNIAKNEQFKTLRISAINCIMSLAHVLDDNDFHDNELRAQIAEVFLFLLPGIAGQLKSVALIDEKYGHKIPAASIKAWGRIVTLIMQNYDSIDQKSFQMVNTKMADTASPKTTKELKWKDLNELKEYLKHTGRSSSWYKDTDINLKRIINDFAILTHHSHRIVRLELLNMAALIIENCLDTMPESVSQLLRIVIALSGDDDEEIANRGKEMVSKLSAVLSGEEIEFLLENLEDEFYASITILPRKFNGIDEGEKLVALNLLYGYLDLFGKHNLTRVLHSNVHLNTLVQTLLHISELDKAGISLLEDYTLRDFKPTDLRDAWKKFQHFKEAAICHKIAAICNLLAQLGAGRIIADFLLDTINNDSVNRKEAIFLLNELILGLPEKDDNFALIKDITVTYFDNWSVPLATVSRNGDFEFPLGEIQSNVVQVCLLVEGIGKIAINVGENFGTLVLKALYSVLERAGSGHPLIRSAGLVALSNIASACGYGSISDLLAKKIYYFSFFLEKKLKRVEESADALSVLIVLIRYSNLEALDAKSHIIRDLLEHISDSRRDRTVFNHYLSVFKVFIQSLKKWLNITPEIPPLKTKKQKQESIENFQVTNAPDEQNDDFSDDVMEGKTPEELYREDLEQCSKPSEDNLEYEKREPPLAIKLSAEILQKTLHFLPSKDDTRKLLVLEILKDGIELLKDWDNELLPIVHRIWAPLVDRFKETTLPVVINYSFQLLVVLARLAKDFIRMRTSKEVLPNVLVVLDKLAEKSYLKDVGSAYRYSQDYKLQLTILGGLARVLTDLDVGEEQFEASMKVVFSYMSDKQPIPLQNLALDFFEMLVRYDPESKMAVFRKLGFESKEYDKNRNVIYLKFR